MASINAHDYAELAHFLKQASGIELGANKQYLVESRLVVVFKQFNIQTFSELLPYFNLSNAYAERLKSAVIDAMTTNETSWFRDDQQFHVFQKDVLPDIALRKRGAIKIWSAACSSGQEPYTISICLSEMQRLSSLRPNVQIIATDISETVLSNARCGIYNDIMMQRGLDAALYKRYFQPIAEGHQVTLDVMKRVRFQQLNLLEPFTQLGKFDIIFCRNVLIYFSEEVKRDILTRLADRLEPNGYLFLSSTESIPADLTLFETIRSEHIRYFRKKS